MNPNDLPLKEKLAALIEAGRACHPDMLHVRDRWGNGKQTGCAMTFAAMGLGVGIPDDTHFREVVEHVAKAMGVEVDDLSPLAERVVHANDSGRLSLDSIVQGLRDESLPAPPTRRGMFIETAFLDELYAKSNVSLGLGHYIAFDESKQFKTISFGNYDTAWKVSIADKLPKAVPQPAAKVRVSTKSGATWPVAKGCYA